MSKPMLKGCCAMLLLAGALAWAGTLPEPGGPGEESAGASYMGVDVQDVTTDRVPALKLKEERGAEITMVDQDAPAGKAGLREHDVILEFNGQAVESVEQLRRMIHEIPPGRKVTVGISRDGRPMQISLQLASRAQAKNLEQRKWMPAMPPVVIPDFDLNVHPSARYGLVVDNLTPQLGDFFGVKNGEGVLVRSVEKGSPAEAAGFRAGDVIVRVQNDKIADRADWRSALRAHRSGKVSIVVVRDKREQTLSINVPETKSDHSEIHIDLPELDDSMEELEIALNQMGPEVEQALEQSRQAVEQSCRDARRQAEEARKQVEKDMQKLRPEIERQMKELRKQMRKTQRELGKTIEEL